MQEAKASAAITAPTVGAAGTVSPPAAVGVQSQMQEEQCKAVQPAPPARNAAEHTADADSKQKRAPGSAAASGDASPVGAADAVPVVLSLVNGAPTGSARTLPAPAEVSHQQQQQQGACPAGHGCSAGPAHDPEHAGSRRFTPAQQAVAAALMVVLKRAMRDGQEAACAAKMNLLSNNQATRPLLRVLPDYGPLPKMQHVEREASVQLRESLSKLAEQCAAAHCQPLEVFARSVQCTTHRTALESLADKAWVHERRRRLCNLALAMTEMDALQVPAAAIEPGQVPGLQLGLANLAFTFLNTFKHLQIDECQRTTLHRADLDHMLPGTVDHLAVEDVTAKLPQLMAGLMLPS